MDWWLWLVIFSHLSLFNAPISLQGVEVMDKAIGLILLFMIFPSSRPCVWKNVYFDLSLPTQ